MSLLKGKGVLTKFDSDGNVVSFLVFEAPPVSDSREPDAVYTKTENGWVSESGDALSADDGAELDALVAPVVVEEPPAPVESTNPPEDSAPTDATPAEEPPADPQSTS